ncbi:MAG: alpha/beta hydrolase [Trueperaceae bacterium]|nr:alpha/beta hydrolase [Trueperaceae bacterium]
MPLRIKVSLVIVALLVALVVIVPLVVPVGAPTGTRPLAEVVAQAARPDAGLVPAGAVELYAVQRPYSGPGTAPISFVLLHAYGSNAFSFDLVLDDLARYGDVVAFDRPGFGLSERPTPSASGAGADPYSEAAQVEQTVALIERLGLSDVVLVGDNAGGVLALEVAIARPDLVAGLVLVGTPAYLLQQGGGAPKWVLRTPQLARLGPVFMRQLAGQPGEQLYAGAWFDASRITPGQRAARSVGTTVEGWDAALWQVTLAGAPRSLEGRLGGVVAPALVLVGAAAGSVPASESERLAAELPSATLEHLDACGDLPQEECPGQFVDLVTTWLADQGPAGARYTRPHGSAEETE